MYSLVCGATNHRDDIDVRQEHENVTVSLNSNKYITVKTVLEAESLLARHD